ncbi:MAG: protein of unknown function [Nitrospira sp.]
MGDGYFSFEMMTYALAIAALLGLWLFHQAQVRAGRILAVDLFDRSLVRMYVYAAPQGAALCHVCDQAQGRVFLSTKADKTGFSPTDGPCEAEGRCQGRLIGLYGGWTEAREIVARLQRSSKNTVVRLSSEELRRLVTAEWGTSVSANTDRINVHMLEGLCLETSAADRAAAGYRYVIERAADPRHLCLVAPAYLRLVDLLTRTGFDEDASRTIEQFERRFPAHLHGLLAPSIDQRKILEEKKSLLWKRRSLKVSA